MTCHDPICLLCNRTYIYYCNDIVIDSRWPSKKFKVVRVSPWVPGNESTYDLIDLETNVYYFDVKESYLYPRDPETKPAAPLSNIDLKRRLCYPHSEGATPLPLAEKGQEVWHICKKCGEALRPVKTHAIKSSGNEDPLF